MFPATDFPNLDTTGLSGAVQVAEQFPGVLSAAKPRRARSTAKWSRQQSRTSLKVAVKLMGAGHTEWIGNDKSATHRQSWRLAGFRRGMGVYQAQSCLGCAEAAFAVYKNKICRLPPWLSDAVERPKSEPRPDPLRLNRRVLSEWAVVRPESRLYSKLGCQTDPSERTLGRIGCTSDRCGFRSEVPPR